MPLARNVAIVGAGMTRFHHRIHIDKSSRELFVEAALESLDSVDKGIGFEDVEALFVGNFSSDLFEGQTHTAPLMADWLNLTPKPATRVEDACASSGVALNMGIMSIASGVFDVVIVAGVEKMRTLSTEEITDTLAMAADAVYEVRSGFTFPGLYASIATAHFVEYGSNWEQLAAVAIKNHNNGALNPKAHFQSSIRETATKLGERRGITFKDEMDFLKSSLNPVIAYPLRLFDCCPISDGSAVIILAAQDIAKKFTDTPVSILGFGQASDSMALHDRKSLTTLKATKMAASHAYKMAGLDPGKIDLAEVHDCFTIAEILAIEDLGLFPKGEGGKATVEGRTKLNGEVSINPDGGLKAKGHPVGATGAAMTYEIFKQLRGEAGSHQVRDANFGLTQNVGASGATVSVQIYGR